MLFCSWRDQVDWRPEHRPGRCQSVAAGHYRCGNAGRPVKQPEQGYPAWPAPQCQSASPCRAQPMKQPRNHQRGPPVLLKKQVSIALPSLVQAAAATAFLGCAGSGQGSLAYRASGPLTLQGPNCCCTPLINGGLSQPQNPVRLQASPKNLPGEPQEQSARAGR